MSIRGLGFVVGLAAAATLGAAPPLAFTELPEYAQAKATALAVLDSTRALLTREIADKGAAGALKACSAVALGVALEHEREGWRVRRVSQKPRNPADAPDPTEAAVLEEWAKRHRRTPLAPETESLALVERGGRRALRYMKPIVIGGELCLACHGPAKKLSPAVRQALHEWYPSDRATGYRLGDLRGAISVTIPLADSTTR